MKGIGKIKKKMQNGDISTLLTQEENAEESFGPLISFSPFRPLL